MKRLFLIVALIVSASASTFTFAQTKAQAVKVNETTQQLHPVYMYVHVLTSKFETQWLGRWTLEASVIRQGFNKLDLFCDEKGTVIEFVNMPELMNYLSLRGWEYVDCYRAGDDVRSYFLFRKMVKSDEEMQKGLYFKSHFENQEHK